MCNIQKKSDVLTLDEFAECLSISRSYAYTLLTRGDVKGVKMGRIWRVPIESVNEYFQKALKKDYDTL